MMIGWPLLPVICCCAFIENCSSKFEPVICSVVSEPGWSNAGGAGISTGWPG